MLEVAINMLEQTRGVAELIGKDFKYIRMILRRVLADLIVYHRSA